MPIWLIVGLLAILAGALTLAVKLVRLLAAASRRRSRGTTTTGVVVAVDERGEDAGEGIRTVFFPTVEFTGIGGVQRFRNRMPVANCPPRGGQVPVWYDPGDPRTQPEVVDRTVTGTAMVYIAGLVGIALLGAFLWWFGLSWAG